MTTTVDAGKAEAFAGRMTELLNNSMLAFMVSVGDRTGLFDALASTGAVTSDKLAAHAGLNERYVREWLNAMTVGRVVDYDPTTSTYALPAEHAASLTHDAGPGNLASMTQFAALLGGVEDGIVECFRHGGGVPYSEFPKFQDLMGMMSAQIHDAALFTGTLPLVDGIVGRLESGIDVCDVGCGQGHALNLMAEAFPHSRFVGWDFSTDGIAAARAEAERRGLGNVLFEVQDAAKITARSAFDFITVFDAIHDQAKPDVVLANIATALRADGVFLCVDISASSNVEENLDHPLGPMMYSISTFHCMTVSLALDGAGLGTMWGEQLANQMLRDAGFATVETKRLPEDIFNVYYVAKKT